MKNVSHISVIVAVTILFTATFSAFGQNSIVRYGVKGGINFSSIGHFEVGSIDESVNSKTGFNAGVAFQIALPVRGLALQPELLYISKGARFRGETDIFVNMGYIEVPVNIQAGLDLILFRPFLELSPYIGYCVYKDWHTDTITDVDKVLNIKVDNFEYGIGIGGGVDVWRFQAKVRYCWNFGVIAQPPSPIGIVDVSTSEVMKAIVNGRLRGLEVSLGFFF